MKKVPHTKVAKRKRSYNNYISTFVRALDAIYGTRNGLRALGRLQTKWPHPRLRDQRHRRPRQHGRCETERLERESDELNDAAGCGPWMLLVVGFIVTLTAIGVSLIIISTELAR